MAEDPLGRDSFGIWSDGQLADEPFSEDAFGIWSEQLLASSRSPTGKGRRFVLPRVEDRDEEAAILIALFELGVL